MSVFKIDNIPVYICNNLSPYFYHAVMPQCLSVRPSVTFRSLTRCRDHIGWNTSKIISPPNSEKIVMWRFLRNSWLILRLHYFQGTHILGASRGGPCDSVASCSKGALITTPRRNRLGDEHFQKLLFLNASKQSLWLFIWTITVDCYAYV